MFKILEHLPYILCRDANHSDLCRIIPIFKANFRSTISDIKIPANNDFKMAPDKIKEVTSTCTLIWRKLQLGDNYTPITGSKIRFRLVCALFIGKKLL